MKTVVHRECAAVFPILWANAVKAAGRFTRFMLL